MPASLAVHPLDDTPSTVHLEDKAHVPRHESAPNLRLQSRHVSCMSRKLRESEHMLISLNRKSRTSPVRFVRASISRVSYLKDESLLVSY